LSAEVIVVKVVVVLVTAVSVAVVHAVDARRAGNVGVPE